MLEVKLQGQSVGRTTGTNRPSSVSGETRGDPRGSQHHKHLSETSLETGRRVGLVFSPVQTDSKRRKYSELTKRHRD